ncbi:MAG TPA: class I SAM-dependent methyltransferase [Steroidobacteraceae bacterium]|nr:class I SAM-dependent methyltransferase [Steroidobacteraceae bacterium]
MKGFVLTPPATVDLMVERMFQDRWPRRNSRLLDAGCGHGAFIEGVLRWCRHNQTECPEIVGIELDPTKLLQAKRLLASEERVTLVEGDFLTRDLGSFDYIIGNPPYVGIEELSKDELSQYRHLFQAARGRVDLYLLFWERSIRVLKDAGRIVFITPEKYTYVETARPLRRMMSSYQLDELLYAPEDTFPGLTTYPVIATLTKHSSKRETTIQLRDGTSHTVQLPTTGESWQPVINKSPSLNGAKTLADISLRVSCGVATGSDEMFLFDRAQLPAGFGPFAKPAIAGRDLRPGQPLKVPHRVLVMPYDEQGALLPLDSLGEFADYLQQDAVRARLEARTCARRKPWYAFHETPPLPDMLRPKLVCKDIAKEPYFWLDADGGNVPLHSSYYVVPSVPQLLEPLLHFLNSHEVRNWLFANCQRAANGFVRMQSTVMKKLPVPDKLVAALVECSLAA